MSGDRPGWDQAVEAATKAVSRSGVMEGDTVMSLDEAVTLGAALDAAYPVIVAAVRQHIAAEIEAEADSLPRYWDGAIKGLRRAAHIARGES